jgi:hypothetical protein
MLTDEQKQKAVYALLPSIEDLERAHVFELHKQAVKEGMRLYGLPFRVYFDYLKRIDNMGYEERNNIVLINPCYPEEGYPLDKIRIVTLDDLDMSNIPRDDNGYMDLLPFEDISTLKTSVQNEILHDIEPLRKWHIHDDNWKRYFSHFLVGYDFDSFTEFDFTGVSGKATSEDIQLLRHIYTRLQREYEERVLDGYLTEEPRTNEERKRRYTDKPYKILLDKDTIEERERLTKQLGIEPSYTDEEYEVVFGTEPFL